MQYTPDMYTGPSEFCHLHTHTCYSTLDGCSLPSQYAEKCYERKWPALAATEHGHMASVPDMFFEFNKYGVKFIAGVELYLNDYELDRQRYSGSIRQLKNIDADLYSRYVRNRHLTVLCKNQVGFHNLIKLTTQAYETGFYYKPRVWFDKLCEFKEGLIVLSGCLNGPVAHELRLEKPRYQSDDGRGAIDWVRKFRNAFGDDYYIETQMPGIERDEFVFEQLITIADHFKIKVVLANDAHYLKREDFQIQKLMMAIDQGTTVDDPELFHVNSDEQFLKTRAELWATFKNGLYSKNIDDRVFEEMCDNSVLVADKCEKLHIDTGPKLPEIVDADKVLVSMVKDAMVSKGLINNHTRYLVDGQEVTYAEQAAIELRRIIDKGFSSYFIITSNIIRYGKQQGWLFSPRGSAGGCLINYLLDISLLDPLKWHLSFDRFLSPSRGGYMLKLDMPEPVSI